MPICIDIQNDLIQVDFRFYFLRKFLVNQKLRKIV